MADLREPHFVSRDGLGPHARPTGDQRWGCRDAAGDLVRIIHDPALMADELPVTVVEVTAEGGTGTYAATGLPPGTVVKLPRRTKSTRRRSTRVRDDRFEEVIQR